MVGRGYRKKAELLTPEFRNVLGGQAQVSEKLQEFRTGRALSVLWFLRVHSAFGGDQSITQGMNLVIDFLWV
jgi:hypothetical protein